MMRYWAVWLASLLLEMSGALLVGLTFVAVVLIVEYQRRPVGVPADEFSALVANLSIIGVGRVVLGGFLLALALFVAGQLLLLLLHMERNSRRTSEILAVEFNKIILEEVRRLHGLTKGE